MDRIALCGSMYSGKSTIAGALEREGYMRIIFTDLLKELTAKALTHIGTGTTKEDVLNQKRKYRALLQEFGAVIGFSTDPYYVRRALFPWFDSERGTVVFDNVRTPEQFAVLQNYAFKLVRVEVPDWVQSARAQAAGVGLEELQRVRNHPIEQGTGLVPDVVLDGTSNTVTNVRFLISEKEYSVQETR